MKGRGSVRGSVRGGDPPLLTPQLPEQSDVEFPAIVVTWQRDYI